MIHAGFLLIYFVILNVITHDVILSTGIALIATNIVVFAGRKLNDQIP